MLIERFKKQNKNGTFLANDEFALLSLCWVHMVAFIKICTRKRFKSDQNVLIARLKNRIRLEPFWLMLNWIGYHTNDEKILM